MAAPLRAVFFVKHSVFQAFKTALPQDRVCCYSYHVVHSKLRISADGIRNTGCTTGLTQVRNASFMNSLTGEDLWKGVTGVSGAGKKKGRGKRVGRKKTTDLNRGQMIGEGRANMVWPGLNAPVVKGREVVHRTQLPPNPDRENELVRMRDKMSQIRYFSLPPLQRGWSGNRFPGQSVGPPDPVADYTFEGFDTRVLEFKMVSNMTGTLGRKMRFTAFVVTGNGNGLAGFGLGKSQNGRTAIRIAKNRAAQQLQYIERFDDHTVYHNMFSQFHRSKVFIHKKERGYGLVCHRALKTLCQLVGFKDLHCKVEGSTKNIQTVIKAFFQAMQQQETHQALADRLQVHVVEQSSERENLPVIRASPSDEKTREEPLTPVEDIEVDYDRFYLDGKVEYKKPQKKWFYEKLPSWRYKQAKVHKNRNQLEAQLQRKAGLW